MLWYYVHLPVMFIFGYFCRHSLAETNNVQYTLQYIINETASSGEKICNLYEDLLRKPKLIDETGLLSLVQSSKLQFELRDPTAFFEIDRFSGVLSTKMGLDLEQLCSRFCRDGATQAQLHLFINLWLDREVIATIHSLIIVKDVDDNSPHFPSNIPRPYVLRLKEVIYRSGQRVELPKAIDKDIEPENKNIVYRLESHPEDNADSLKTFQLLSSNDSRLMLVLQQNLDYENIKLYKFYLVAIPHHIRDGTSDSLYKVRDQLEIHVEVLNMNDIEPVFAKSLFKIDIKESILLNTTIFTLSATDLDANSSITYSMEPGSDEQCKNMFTVEPNGKVRLTSQPDFEKRDSYDFTVRASDGEFFALTRLSINILDTNDEFPEAITSPTNLSVMETSPSNTFVGNVIITDRDSPEVNGLVVCQEPPEKKGNQPLLFVEEASEVLLQFPLTPQTAPESRIYQNFGVYTTGKFDRETGPPIYKSVLLCWDGVRGEHTSVESLDVSLRASSTLTISLTIRDMNDNMPVFVKGHYEAKIKENCPIGTRVIQVHANDADYEPHAIPRYFLARDDLFNRHFKVEPETGWVLTQTDIDRETQALHRLTILAIDGLQSSDSQTFSTRLPGNYRFTATTQVLIHVTDENDNAPEFRGPRQFAVEENQPPNTWIADLQAFDADEGINGEVEFMLHQYHINTFTGLGNNSKRIKTSERIPQIPFLILQNGSLYTAEKLDREMQSHYCFEVSVRDRATGHSKSSTDTICIGVLDVNDNSPNVIRIKGTIENKNATDSPNETIEHSSDKYGVPEASEHNDVVVAISIHEDPGYCVFIVEAKDLDDGRNAKLRYGLKRTNSHKMSKNIRTKDSGLLNAFMMDPQNGRMILTRKLHTGDLGIYSLIVIIEDSGKPKKRTEKTIKLLLEDSPSKGNWLFHDTDVDTRHFTISKYQGASSETQTVIIVVIMSGVSALVAAILISAILCMIKPCNQKSTNRNGSRRFNKRISSNLHTDGQTPSSDLLRKLSESLPASYAGESLAMMQNNGIIGTFSDRSSHRSILLTPVPIPGLDHLYLPQDKVIGVESEGAIDAANVDTSNWASIDGSSVVFSTPPVDGISSPMSIYEYRMKTCTGSTWMPSVSQRTISDQQSGEFNFSDNQNTFGQTEIPAASTIMTCQNPVSSHAVVYNFAHTTDPENSPRTHLNYKVNSRVVSSPIHTCNQKLKMFGDTMNIHCLPPELINMNQVIINTERNITGEEQRSDSGRGGSDEEATNHVQTSTFGSISSRMRSATLRTFQDNASHITSGLVYPSLPRRIVDGTQIKDPVLDVRNSTNVPNDCQPDATSHTVPGHSVIIRLPKNKIT